MKTKHYILCIILFASCSLQAQVSNYTLSNCMIPYESIGANDSLHSYIVNNYPGILQNTLYNGNLIGSNQDSLSGEGFPIGFPFYFDGAYYDRFAISTNYYIKLGKSSEGNFTIHNEREKGSVFQSGNNDLRSNTISLFQRTMTDDSIKILSQLSYTLNGTPGNRDLRIRWGNYRSPGPIGRCVYLRLFEKTRTILFSYSMDTMKYAKVTGSYPNYVYYPGDLPFMQAAVGLRGNQQNNNMSNLNMMKVTKGVNTWTTPERGTSQTDLCDMDEHFMPLQNGSGEERETGCEYWCKWTPPIQGLSKPFCPSVYFVYTDGNYLKANAYHYEKMPLDNATGNSYGFINIYHHCYLFANGAKSIPVNDATLQWNKAIGVDSFDVYFGLTYPPVLVNKNTTDTTYTPSETLAPATTYYYSIVAKNTLGNSNKCIGSFTSNELPISDCIPTEPPYCADCYDFSFNTLIYNQVARYASTFLIPETAYTTSVKRGGTYSYATKVYTERFVYPNPVTPYIYIDWNKDGDFTDANEKFSSGNITIPLTAKLGKTYLRTYWRSSMATGSDNPCGGIDKSPKQQFVISILPSEACSAFVLNYERTNTHCYGDSTGTITLQPSGGTAPYTYAWTDGNTEQTRSGLPVGTYQATVTDATGCDQTTPLLAIQSPFLIQMDTITVNDSLMIYISGGTGTYTYQWTKDGNHISQSELQLPVAGVYSLSITDEALCSVTYDGIVVPENIENALPVVKSANKTLVVYPNPTIGEINISSQHIIQKIEIVSLSGKRVYSKTNIKDSKINLNIASLPVGVYLVKAYTEKGVDTKEIIKQ